MGGLDRATEFDPRLRETRVDLSHPLLGKPFMVPITARHSGGYGPSYSGVRSLKAPLLLLPFVESFPHPATLSSLPSIFPNRAYLKLSTGCLFILLNLHQSEVQSCCTTKKGMFLPG